MALIRWALYIVPMVIMTNWDEYLGLWKVLALEKVKTDAIFAEKAAKHPKGIWAGDVKPKRNPSNPVISFDLEPIESEEEFMNNSI